jgi:hypothetical protein
VKAHADEDVAPERREIQDPVVTPEPARAQRAMPVDPVRVGDVLREGGADERREDPRDGAAGRAPCEAARDEDKVGRVVEDPAGRGGGAPAARDGAVEEIGRDRSGEREGRERGLARAAAGHEGGERHRQDEAGGRQRVGHQPVSPSSCRAAPVVA